MVSLFSALNISSNALSVNEKAISVVSHNVANMNTEGYSKQKVNLATRNIAGAIGNNVTAQIRSNGGVMIANVMRYNDSYLNNYYRDELSKLKEYEQQLGNLDELADIFNDLEGEGIDGALSAFYEALNNLNEYPASSTARVNFIETAKTLVSVMNSKSQELDQLTTNALGDGVSQEALESSKIYVQYENFNNKLEELAEINKALQVTQTGTLTANNLLDKRDMILNDIAEFVDFDIEEKANGTVNLYIGGTAMVQGSVVTGELDIQTAQSYCQANGIDYPDGWVNADGTPREAAVISIIDRSGDTEKVVVSDANDMIQGGTLGGLLHSADLDGEGMNVGKVKSSLDTLAQTIADIFNELNTRNGAYCINPDNTGELIAADPNNLIFVGADGTGQGITAGNISLNSDLLTDDGCWLIAAAYFEDGQNFDINAVGNAQNIAAMLGTRTEKLDVLNGMSMPDYYTSLVGKIASAGNSIQTLYDTQSDIVESINTQILENNSVDLNEELVDLVKYQTAYSASAQVFNVCNNCLDTLMSLGG